MRAGPLLFAVVGVFACATPLLPGELVLGDDVTARVVEGEAGSALGWSVAVGEVDGALVVLVGAPGAGRVVALSVDGDELWEIEGPPDFGERVGVAGGVPWAWAPGDGIFAVGPEGAVLLGELPTASAVALCPTGEVLSVSGRGESVSCGPLGALRTQCGGECVVEVRQPGEGAWEEIGVGGSGGAVGWWADQACWGSPDRESDGASGRVTCRGVDGEVVGQPGDHLGGALGGGRATGVFSRDAVPRRGRIVPLPGESGDVWAVDRAAPGSRLSLGGDAGITVVGVPGFGATEAREGRVYIVESGP